jgi:hypothetical protein
MAKESDLKLVQDDSESDLTPIEKPDDATAALSKFKSKRSGKPSATMKMDKLEVRRLADPKTTSGYHRFPNIGAKSCVLFRYRSTVPIQSYTSSSTTWPKCICRKRTSNASASHWQAVQFPDHGSCARSRRKTSRTDSTHPRLKVASRPSKGGSRLCRKSRKV